MTFDEWWDSLTTREENSMDKDGAMAAWEFGQLEAAEHILEMFHGPMPITRLKAYVDELK